MIAIKFKRDDDRLLALSIANDGEEQSRTQRTAPSAFGLGSRSRGIRCTAHH